MADWPRNDCTRALPTSTALFSCSGTCTGTLDREALELLDDGLDALAHVADHRLHPRAGVEALDRGGRGVDAARRAVGDEAADRRGLGLDDALGVLGDGGEALTGFLAAHLRLLEAEDTCAHGDVGGVGGGLAEVEFHGGAPVMAGRPGVRATGVLAQYSEVLTLASTRSRDPGHSGTPTGRHRTSSRGQEVRGPVAAGL